ncbi:peptidyl-tRNA hydrolase isoform X1 [Bos indicus]|uniref:peptidyl-tRNA hydrolase n=3 Tax=Bos TaxID=9903 RepID=A0A4W2HU51_BOBOX|nr:probable peptidyl-tRNA hydrolase isoform X1 [Bos indicus x Bos taurus]XP_059747569.1 peptidyl-tRNA hydrolase isoform X1 [Bos taurus]DAA24224.1 TPA: peptidyl-tRNA hydrolase 1 homolog-like isoform 1 [Bos taurus]
MGLPGLSRAGLWLSRAMSRCVLEPRPAGKRWLVAGLGNPGLPGTRHSVGMAVLGQLARRLGVAESWERDRRCAADLAQASLGDAQLVLLRPRRLMNLNGHSVAQAVVTGATVSLGQVELFGLTAEEVYLVHDELDKPLGKVALKLGGSARGHNGVRSCMSCLNSNAMPRLQVGIGRPTHRDAVQAYVLGRFSPAEQELLPPVLERAVDLLLGHIHQRSRESSSGP